MTRSAALTSIVWAAGLAPLPILYWAGTHHRLGVDVYHGLTTETGVWSMRFLCATLVMTPLRRLTHWNEVIRHRRLLGLFAFFYGTLHVLAYLVFDRFAGLELRAGVPWWETAIGLARDTTADVMQRPFLAIGFASFLIMVPLAISSSPEMIRRLGGRRWQRLHRFVYAAAVAGLLHHWWPPGDRLALDGYGIILLAAFAYRLWRRMAWPVQYPRAAPQGAPPRG
jgi:sulfoxide reductase heme-binding subunit YedZ